MAIPYTDTAAMATITREYKAWYNSAPTRVDRWLSALIWWHLEAYLVACLHFENSNHEIKTNLCTALSPFSFTITLSLSLCPPPLHFRYPYFRARLFEQ
jgi:hypothetical protein